MDVRRKVREIIEEILGEEYPETFSFQQLEDIVSYAGKLRYAETHLQKLASGSARVVYKVDDAKVLKMAKNKKGLAQNSVEAQGYLQNYDIVAQVFETDYDDYWIEMEYARKVSKADFKRIAGISIEELGTYLRYMRFEMNPRRGFMGFHIEPEVKRRMEDSEFVDDLMHFVNDNDMETGDMGRLSTWGKVLRDGEERIVLIDYGLTNSVYKDYYMVS
jgi:hypothetical protein